MKDWVTGEEVQYTYDALQRLTRAETIGPEWGSTYGYDGFGNLLQKSPVKGSGVPLLNIAVDPATNRVSGLSGGSYDANGNDLTAGAFDIANRLKQSGSTYFQYDAANKRVWKGTVAGGAITSEEFYFYAPWGAKLAAYKPTNYLNIATMTIVSSNEYFGGKLIKINGTAVLTDRLGSNVSNGKRYFPYGEERGSTANNIEKFGTYFRDAETGLDYADQRYYKGSWGRFGSADRAWTSAIPAEPGSWNRFAYVTGDVVNLLDPTGDIPIGASTFWWASSVIKYDSITVYGGTLGLVPYHPAAYGFGLGAGANLPAMEALPPGFEYDIVIIDPCAWLPDAAVIGLQVQLGVVGGPTFTGEFVLNYHTGELTGFFSAGAGFGLLAGAQIQGSAGFVWGIGSNNNSYGGGNTSIGVAAGPIGGQVSVNSSGTNSPLATISPSLGTAVSMTIGLGLLDLSPISGNAGAANTVISHSFGSMAEFIKTFAPFSFDAYMLNMQELCRKEKDK